MEDQVKIAKLWGALIRKIWDDPSLKEELKSNSHKFLKDNGIAIHESQTIEIHENTPEKIHLILPEKPKKDLSDEILAHIVAGSGK